jgi:Sulfotransferase family
VTGPTFFVVGAGRSGTTSLHQYLSGVPIPDWEVPAARRMARNWVSSRAEYDALFAGITTERAAGDVSPVYLQARSASYAIAAAYPHARIIAILRDPVERAHAHWLGRRRDGIDSRPDFSAIIDAELDRGLPDEIAFGSYLGIGRYHHFLRDYLDLFPADHVKVCLFDDLRADANGLLADIFEFLGVDPAFSPDTSVRHGQTGTINSTLARAVWTRSVTVRTALRPYIPAAIRDRALPLASRSGLSRPNLEPELRTRMLAAVRDDIERLQVLISRDLSAWLTVP